MTARHHGGPGIRLMGSSHAWSYADAVSVTGGDPRPLLAVLAGEGMFGEDLSWQDDAPCGQADPERWFPEKGESSRPAKMICRSCPSRLDCLRYALDRDQEHGIWAGLSREERQEAARARKQGASLEAIAAAADAAWDASLKAADEHCRAVIAAAGAFYAESARAVRAERRASLGLPESPSPQSMEPAA